MERNSNYVVGQFLTYLVKQAAYELDKANNTTLLVDLSKLK